MNALPNAHSPPCCPVFRPALLLHAFAAVSWEIEVVSHCHGWSGKLTAKKSSHWTNHAAKTGIMSASSSKKSFPKSFLSFPARDAKFSEANDSVREVYATGLCQLREKYP